MTRVLFVTWDSGDTNYMESLFLPIQGALARHGYELHVLQFTWAGPERRSAVRAAAERHGVGYRRLPVWRKPAGPATLAMIATGAAAVRAEARRVGADIVMPRSIVPTAMTLGARRLGLRARVCMDADGLSADERVEFAGWSPSGAQYRMWRRIEAAGVTAADAVICRTARARQILAERAPAADPAKIFAIPNGSDADRFSPGTAADRAALRLREGISPSAPVLLYCGGLGPQYRPDAMLAAADRALRHGARVIVLTGTPDAAPARAFADRGAIVRRVPAADVPAWLAAADLGLAIRTATFSQRAVSPIKIGEYLLAGLPVAASAGIGDTDAELADAPLAATVLHPGADEPDRIAQMLLQSHARRDEARAAARQLGLRLYSLDTCVARTAAALDHALS